MQLKVNDRIVRKGGAARGYMPTPWGLGRPLPVYPDVPRYIERALAEGRMRHFLSWNTSDHSIDRRVDPARVEPLGRPWYDSGPTLVNESLLPHAQYRLT